MKIVDTHSHIYADEFDQDRDAVVARAKENGLVKILLPNIDIASIGALHHLADEYPNYCIPMMGLHPTSVGPNWAQDLEFIKQEFSKRRYCAIGEIGIDLYWDKTFEAEQKLAFEEQLRWSIEYDLPVAIHTRNAIFEAITCIQNIGAEKLRGVFHSFGGTREELSAILALQNFYIGINGVVTFKNSDLRDVLKDTDLSHIIVETDSPYLTPAPFRGKRNESSYTVFVVKELAKAFAVSEEEVADITTANAYKLFSL